MGNDFYAHLGDYSDWVSFTGAGRGTTGRPSPAPLRRLVASVLPAGDDEQPRDVRVERRWRGEGVDGEELSWSVGFGPRTVSWVLKPEAAGGPLPAVLALHGHDGFKYYGKEKIADGPDATPEVVTALRRGHYSGRAFANELAREGYVVLVPDTFGWGSRRFPLDQMPPLVGRLGRTTAGTAPPDAVPGAVPPEVAQYNAAAWHHENIVEKYCRLLGTTLAAVVCREDRIALTYLQARDDVTGNAAAIGLSGGGCRSALLRATRPDLAAAVVVGMMSTYAALLDHNVVDHTWMLFPAGFPAHADWPDLAAAAAPAPLLVQYNREDPLFPLPGAQAADRRIAEHYAAAGDAGAYAGQFYDGGHKFDRAMQRAAFDWLDTRLR
jgi:dienelactone hydrolase